MHSSIIIISIHGEASWSEGGRKRKSQPGGHDPNRVTRTASRHGTHGVTKVVLLLGHGVAQIMGLEAM